MRLIVQADAARREPRRALVTLGDATRKILVLLVAALIGGCAIYAGDNWDQLFGDAEPRERMEAADSAPGKIYLEQVQPILEQRCVVCHGCYDSPCQLNMAAAEGIDRGASKAKVYDSARLQEAPLTRLFEDAHSSGQWRSMGFYPVLNEHKQNSDVNLQASVMHHMLTLKRDNPLPEQPLLPKSIDLGLNRKQECPKLEEIDEFSSKHPLWGMPFGLPGLPEQEFATLEQWLEQGARMALPPGHGPAVQSELDKWEQFLNGDSLKQQLMSRYLFEHWFLAHLYFDGLDTSSNFKLVRSSTPPGQPIAVLATRRPYDDPGVTPVYYRFWRDYSTVLDKTHMPYALDGARMVWLQSLFLDKDYPVDALPSYEPDVAANPFIAFQAIPVESRWQFLMAEAQFTIMNFIKGPVCRGQVALDVIRDNFWVFLVQPNMVYSDEATAFLNQQKANLRMPMEAGSSAAVASWHSYAKSEGKYLEAKSAQLDKFFSGGRQLDLDLVWDGDGDNQNAALTVFRHFDSASVVKGLVGPEPETAWLIDYPILERIHYLLVAGFDVFGNMEHQLTTRRYMDFLRMEGEFNFLLLLPPEAREAEIKKWYAGASEKQQSYIFGTRANFDQSPDIIYKTDNPKHELYGMLKDRLAPVLNHEYELDQPSVPASQREALQRMQAIKGLALSTVPPVVFLAVADANGGTHYYTVLHNNAHSNITSLFRESKNRQPQDDTLSVVKGFIGSYPSAYWRVAEAELSPLVEQMEGLTDEASYAALMERYGVRRTSPDFWPHSDKVMAAHHSADPQANGLLDYNRLENR